MITNAFRVAIAVLLKLKTVHANVHAAVHKIHVVFDVQGITLTGNHNNFTYVITSCPSLACARAYNTVDCTCPRRP